MILKHLDTSRGPRRPSFPFSGFGGYDEESDDEYDDEEYYDDSEDEVDPSFYLQVAFHDPFD